MAPKKKSQGETKSEEDLDGTQVENQKTRRRASKDSSVASRAGAKNRRKRAQSTNHSMEQPSAVEYLKSFVLDLQKAGFKGILAEFDEIKKETQAIGGTPKTAFDSHPEKNRYKDVFCVDESRVALKYPEGGDDYIHANWAETSDHRKYICTQGPTQGTINDFWRMVWGEKAGAIIMLCNITEQGKKKCEQYFPENSDETAIYGNISVKVTMKKDAHGVLTIRTLLLSVGDESLEVEHIYWKNWPDRGVPPEMMSCFRLINLVRKKSPVVIHCSAGIGRTGTIVALDLVYTRILRTEPVKLKETVIELRRARHGSVQMDVQYIYIARCIIEFAITKKAVPADAVAAFVADYNSFCKQRGFA